MSEPADRPLVLTRDPELLDGVLRLAAVAGVDVEAVTEVGAARRRWSAAPLVVVGSDLVRGCADGRLPRRPGVLVVGVDPDDTLLWQLAVEVGAEHVVFLPDADTWLGAALAEAVEPSGRAGPVLAVVGGRGGAGATTLACGLAVTAVRTGRRALLVDADPLGGGLDLALGAEHEPGLRWPELAATQGRVPGPALVAALPRPTGLPVLSWDRGTLLAVPPTAMEGVLAAAARACDLVVVDLPRGAEEATRVAVELASTVLVVVPAQVRAVAAAGRVAAQLGAWCSDLRVVVRGPFGSRLAPGAVSGALGLPLAGYLESEPRLDAALDRGEAPGGRGRGALAALCTELLGALLTDPAAPVRAA